MLIVMELESSLNDKPEVLFLNSWSTATMNGDVITLALWHLSQHQLSLLFQPLFLY